MANLVLLISAVLLLLSLRNLYASPSRFNFVVGWASMVLFAGMACYFLWLAHQIQRDSRPVYYSLPTTDGLHDVPIRKHGLFRGFRGRLVLKQDHKSAGPSLRQVQACGWSLKGPGGEVLNPGSSQSQDELFEIDDRLDGVTLTYRVSAQTRPFLDQADLEVSIPKSRYDDLAMGGGLSQTFMYCYILSLLMAAFGMTLQRKRLRAQKPASRVTPPPPSDVS